MKLLMIALVVVFSSSLAFRASAATAVASAGAEIENNAIEINKVIDLNFGKIIPSVSQDSTVSIAPGSSGTRTITGPAIGVSSTTRAAFFSVSGNPFAPFSISIPDSIQLVDGLESMEVNSFVRGGGGSPSLSSSGSFSFEVGATLHVKANQPAGIYSGSFEVSVAYL